MAKKNKEKKVNPVSAFLWKDKRRRAKNFYFMLMLLVVTAAVGMGFIGEKLEIMDTGDDQIVTEAPQDVVFEEEDIKMMEAISKAGSLNDYLYQWANNGGELYSSKNVINVLLVGLDVRKPRLAEMFNLPDHKKGVTTFLSGDANDKQLLFDQIMPSGINKNLDILPAGIIPPNPAELLSRKNLDKAIEYLKEIYDYIILDTAPVGMVADTLIISRVTDATVYICRADYTPKDDLKLANSLFKEKKLKNMSIVLNGIDMTKRKYGYYYGYGSYVKRGGRYGQYGKYAPQGYGDNK